jgi:hypothetical protein
VVQTIATTNNAAINAANRDAAIAANSLTSIGYNNCFKQERDIMNYVFQTANNNAERNNLHWVTSVLMQLLHLLR